MIVTADLGGDSWRIEVSDGSEVLTDPVTFRRRLKIPGLLAELGVWDLIESARERLFLGVRVVQHSVYGTSDYVTCLWEDREQGANA